MSESHEIRTSPSVGSSMPSRLEEFEVDESQTLSEELSEEQVAALQEEEQLLETIQKSLQEQLHKLRLRHSNEQKRARELTSELVAATRDEDKAMLASDEAVSHALTDKAFEEFKKIEQMLKKPYFARFVVEEETDDGKSKRLDYRLGFASNPDCRIIDWRKAPISKLYYEYKEGDYYDEEIQGNLRTGQILLRRGFEIENGKLVKVTSSEGVYTKEGDTWIHDRSSEKRRAGRMRDILSLITAEQFQLITEDAESAILLQGIAGSGKTTVALHRLAWLLHNDNSELQGSDCLVLVLTPSLQLYVKQVLDSLNLVGVAVKTYAEWKNDFIRRIVTPEFLRNDEVKRAPMDERAPSALRRLKHSATVITALEKFCKEKIAAGNFSSNYFSTLREFFLNPTKALSQQSQETRHELVRAEDFSLAAKRLQLCEQKGWIDYEDEALLLRMATLAKHPALKTYGHIVIDETQDYSSAELAAVLGMAKSISNTTIVGDASQAVSEHSSFPGWDRLVKKWDNTKELSRFVQLTISHRSTLQIMRLADAVQHRSLVTEGREGKKPIWFQCRREQSAVKVAIDWLSKATERFPNEITAVICATSREAREVFQLLKPSFGESIRLGTVSDFSFDQGIMVTDLHLARGLEFFNVLTWNCSRKNFPSDDRGKNMLYIAATRAEENLSFVSYGQPNKLLLQATPHMRIVREAPPEEEEANAPRPGQFDSYD